MLRLPRFGCSISGWNEPAATPPVPSLQAALRVAGERVLDLDDVGAPVGQHRARRRRERELRDLDHLHALHGLVRHSDSFTQRL